MDILKKYEEQHQETAMPAFTAKSSAEYGFFTRLVMRLSGGMIKDENTASYVLVVVAVVMIIIAGILLYTGSGPGSVNTEDFKNKTRAQEGVRPNIYK